MTSGSNVLRKLGLFYFYTVSYSHCNSRHKHADWCGCAHSKITHSYSNVHTLKHTRTHTQSFNVQWQYSLPSVRKYLSLLKMSLNQHEPQEGCCAADLTLWPPHKGCVIRISVEQPTPSHSHTLPPPSAVTHAVHLCVCLYDLWLFGAAGPERTQADDEKDEEQHRHDGDYRDVAGVG